jgi:hypothetical protein
MVCLSGWNQYIIFVSQNKSGKYILSARPYIHRGWFFSTVGHRLNAHPILSAGRDFSTVSAQVVWQPLQGRTNRTEAEEAAKERFSLQEESTMITGTVLSL